ncbi:MAG: hypothetical protein M3Y72_23435 [Acidobacteriota bacterium]|nr:hypothetical protein [Acidobacteriota bacterium]
MRRNQWAALFFALLLFGSGFAAGILTQRYVSGSVVSAKTAEDFRHHYIAEMKSKLGLSAQQVSDLEKILDDTKAKYKAVRDQSRPAMLKIKEEQIDRVKSILTASQVPIYESLVAERERRYKEEEERDRQAQAKRTAEHQAQPAH